MTRSRGTVLGFLAGDNHLEAAARADIKEFGVLVPAEMLTHHGTPSRREVNRASSRLRRAVFHTTRSAAAARWQRRGIAYDDRSGDCLDNCELQRVLTSSHELLGRPVDLVGMDACLMTMIEASYVGFPGDVTQTAIDLNRLEPLVNAVAPADPGAARGSDEAEVRGNDLHGVALEPAVLRQLLRRSPQLRVGARRGDDGRCRTARERRGAAGHRR